MLPDAPADPSTPSTWHPDLLDQLRTDLLAARYDVARTQELLGPMALAALHRENPVLARAVLRDQEDPAADLLALFTLGVRLPAARLHSCLPTLGLDGAIALGLLESCPEAGTAPAEAPAGVRDPAAGATVRALVDLSPYAATDDLGEISWWIASDLSELATGAALGPDHVLGVGGASLTLARITPRRATGRVLDLGCGGGIQALHAARHAEQVVATDLSARALGFAAFNAALNGITLDLREGSLLDPVAGETFDLVVSNPPFVITPRPAGATEPRWTYRDGGRAGDTLLAELLDRLPGHLAPGGVAVLLGNWEIEEGLDWDRHPTAWLGTARRTGVDAWVIQREQLDPAQYAETWARDGGVTDRDPRWAPLQESWLEDFAGRSTVAIGFGYVLLRHRDPAGPGGSGVLRTEQVTGTGTGSLGEHLLTGLTVLGTLADLDDEALGSQRPVIAADVLERRHLTPGAGDPRALELVQGAGLARVVRADQVLAATIGACEGTLTLEQILGAVCALTGEDLEPARTRVLAQVRDLAVAGLVTL